MIRSDSRTTVCVSTRSRPDWRVSEQIFSASSERVLNVLRSICKEDRIPVIVSLHQLDYAKAFADRIIGLAGGQIVFDGPPTQLSETVLTQIYGSTGQDAT